MRGSAPRSRALSGSPVRVHCADRSASDISRVHNPAKWLVFVFRPHTQAFILHHDLCKMVWLTFPEPSVMRSLYIFFVIFLALWGWAPAEEHLVLIGGGDHPKAAMEQFRAWAELRSGPVLVIPWASADAQASLAVLSRELPGSGLEVAPLAPLDEGKRARFLAQLQVASGVWFIGGDQVKVMKVLQDRFLLEALRASYRGGMVFGGTSAGTAIMSQRMLTGEADLSVLDGRRVKLSQGLGLLPERCIVDQHFLKRQRENRLFGVILDNPDAIGLGIDEDTALLLTDGHQAQVIGGTQVMLVQPQARRNSLLVQLFHSGERFDLDDFMAPPGR